jgi:hypothetical protein
MVDTSTYRQNTLWHCSKGHRRLGSDSVSECIFRCTLRSLLQVYNFPQCSQMCVLCFLSMWSFLSASDEKNLWQAEHLTRSVWCDRKCLVKLCVSVYDFPHSLQPNWAFLGVVRTSSTADMSRNGPSIVIAITISFCIAHLQHQHMW